MVTLPPDGIAEEQPGNFVRHNWLFLFATFLLVAGSLYLLFTSQQGDALVAINGYRTDARDIFFMVGTKLGEPVAYAGVVIIVSAFSFRKALFAVVSGASAGIVAGLLKLYFAQARPHRWLFDNHENVWHQLNHFDEQWRSWSETESFPSGHTASAFALYAFLAFNARTRKFFVSALCLVLALIVGFSRMYLLYHFLRDVTAGAALGTIMAIITYYAQENVLRSLPLDRGWLPNHRGLPGVSAHVPPPE